MYNSNYFNSYSASHDNWCTGTLWNRVITAQCEGMGEVGSARFEPALLPPCPSIRAYATVTVIDPPNHTSSLRVNHFHSVFWCWKCLMFRNCRENIMTRKHDTFTVAHIKKWTIKFLVVKSLINSLVLTTIPPVWWPLLAQEHLPFLLLQ